MEMKMPDLSVDTQKYPSEKSLTESRISLDTLNKKISSVLSVKISSVLSSCRICLLSIFNPAVLTCGHRFCERCLNNYWRINMKPECIICPLCRRCAFNISFSKGAKVPSTEDFRRLFSPIVVSDLDIYRSMIWCLKVMTIVLTVYYPFKLVKPIFVQFYLNSLVSN